MVIHIRIFGRVQGVGFRAWACRKADDLNLSGWVRNRMNGSVEILAEGPDDNINIFLKLCQKGPLFSRVDKIEPVSVPDAFVPPIQQGIFTNEASV
ncbi:MAG: acylphosphatase [Pseudomonadota bacterium]|nr:acylphosphatase [Pseudomonadota bacterium]